MGISQYQDEKTTEDDKCSLNIPPVSVRHIPKYIVQHANMQYVYKTSFMLYVQDDVS